MGEQTIGNLASEKYLGDKISQNGTAASITETIQNRISSALEKTKEILDICQDPKLLGFPTAMGPISEYETKVIPKLLNNAESWLGINDSHLTTLQEEFQDNFLRKVFQVAAKGTPKGTGRPNKTA